MSSNMAGRSVWQSVARCDSSEDDQRGSWSGTSRLCFGDPGGATCLGAALMLWVNTTSNTTMTNTRFTCSEGEARLVLAAFTEIKHFGGGGEEEEEGERVAGVMSIGLEDKCDKTEEARRNRFLTSSSTDTREDILRLGPHGEIDRFLETKTD